MKPNLVEVINNKGLIYHEIGVHERAMDCFNQALTLDPYYIEAWINKGNTLGMLGKHREAVKCFYKALEIDKENLSALVGMGFILTRLSRFREAERYYKKALDIDSDNLYALLNLGYLYSDRLFNYKEALKISYSLYSIQPDLETRTLLVESLIKVGQYREAREHALAIVQETKTDTLHQSLNRFFITCSYYLQGDMKAGNEYMSKFLKMYRAIPKNFKIEEDSWAFSGLLKVIGGSKFDTGTKELLRLSIELLQGKGKREKILADIETKLALGGVDVAKELAIDKGVKGALETILKIADYQYQRFGQDMKKSNPEALPDDLKLKLRPIIESYESLLSVSKGLPINIDMGISEELDIVNLSMTEGEYDKALSQCERILHDQPNNIRALNYRGIILHRTGRHKDAIKNFDTVLAIEPNNIRALVNKGIALDDLKGGDNDKEANALYKRATEIALDHGDSDSIVNKGLAYQKLQNFDKAKECYNIALEINPNELRALVNLGSTLDSEGKHKEALSYYNKALEINPNNLYAIYNKACSYSLLGKFEDSLELLKRVLDLYPKYKEDIREDPDLSKMKSYKPFMRLIMTSRHDRR